MISAALKMCRTAVNQTMHASKRRIFCLSEGELYICEKEAERCAFRFFCFCFGHCRRSGTRRKLVFVVASPKPNACCKRSALVHFRSSTASGFASLTHLPLLRGRLAADVLFPLRAKGIVPCRCFHFWFPAVPAAGGGDAPGRFLSLPLCRGRWRKQFSSKIAFAG